MYKPTKLEQKLYKHIMTDHQPFGFVRPDCEICRKLKGEIEDNSKQKA